MSVGTDLRHAREQRGWSLDELSARTRIAVSMLAAIEANRLDRLPDGFYRRAFLRAYAREVGLDSERVVDDYRTQFADPKEPATAEVVFESPAPPVSYMHLDWLRVQMTLFAILGIAATIALVYVTTRPHLSSVASTPTPLLYKEAPQRGEQSAIGTQGVSASESSAVTEAAILHAPLEVEVQAQAPCWLGATADGKRLVYRVLNKGERLTLQARDELVLRIGDAGAFRFNINGIPGRRLGDPGDDLTLHVTPSNFRKFVQSS